MMAVVSTVNPKPRLSVKRLVRATDNEVKDAKTTRVLQRQISPERRKPPIRDPASSIVGNRREAPAVSKFKSATYSSLSEVVVEQIARVVSKVKPVRAILP
jgi:hypothetical protein